jgi:tRNA threonylcarbamoyladenosine biosynthesis protein TsaB
MNILAIESSSKKLIVGLYIDNDVLKLSSSKINDTANALPLLTKQILKNSSLKHTDLDAVCISTGPGSFTSLRIGMSYAKGLSMSLDIPIIPISTFESLLYNFTDDNIHILIYSHGKTFYLCDYKRKDNVLIQKPKPSTVTIDDVFKLKEKIIYNGPDNYFNELKMSNLNIELVDLNIDNLFEIAVSNFKLLKTKSLDNLVPNYVGNFEIK